MKFTCDLPTEYGTLKDVPCDVSPNGEGFDVSITIGQLAIVGDDIDKMCEDGQEILIERFHELRSEMIDEEDEEDEDVEKWTLFG